MAKSKRNKNQRPSRTPSATGKSKLKNAPTVARPAAERPKMVALVMASLVFGLLAIVNLDRVTHADAEMGIGGSRHGWPWIYLKRELASEPLVFIRGSAYSWPFPPVQGEIREYSWPNLGYDLLFVSLLVMGTYFLLRFSVQRYDNWKYGSHSRIDTGNN